MSSDLQAGSPDELEPKRAAELVLHHEIQEGKEAVQRPPGALALSALSAGLDIGFSLLLMAVMRTEVEGLLVRPVADILVANMYAIGFIFVVLGRSELFTEQTTLVALSVLNRKTALPEAARTWAVIYVCNLVGGTAFAALAVLTGDLLGVTSPHTFGAIAHRMTDHSAIAIFLSALLAGWLMGLLSWLVAASRDTIGQLVIVWLIATVIGFAGLHHVVVGSVEVLAGVFAGQGITAWDFGRFLLWTTLGNAVGGPLFVALIKYSHITGGKTDDRGS